MSIDPEGAEIAALDRLVDFSGLRVLDVGCGDGRLTWRFAEPTAAVLGVDPSEELIAQARGATPAELADRVRFEVCRAEDLDEPPASFDVAFLTWTL